MPGYTLAPQASLTTIVREIGAALDWLGDQGPAHGVAGPVVVSGWSAGAQLAALHLGHRRVVAGLAISGVYDLKPLRDTALNDALRASILEGRPLSHQWPRLLVLILWGGISFVLAVRWFRWT